MSLVKPLARPLLRPVPHSLIEGVGGVGPPVNLVAPVISGTPTAGQTLVCTPGTWSGDPVLTYQWIADGTPISGETDPEGLTLTYAQEGQEIRCEEYAVNAGGSDVAISNALNFAAIELVTNGGFTTNVSWTTPAGWSITDGQLHASGAAAFSTTSQLALNPPGLVAGVTYTVTFTVVSVSAGGVRVAFTGGTGVTGTTRTAPGTYTQDFVANSGNTNLNIQAGSGGFTGVVDNFSVKKK